MREANQSAQTPPSETLLRRWRALGSNVGVLVAAGEDDGQYRPLISLNEGAVLEMGGVFKVVLLAAFARQVERGQASWDQTFVVSPDVRIPHSEVMQTVPDGYRIGARDLLVAMMGRSDNTAT